MPLKAVTGVVVVEGETGFVVLGTVIIASLDKRNLRCQQPITVAPGILQRSSKAR